MGTFAENLESIPTVENTVLLRLYNKRDELVSIIPNIPGRQGSIRVFQHIADAKGEINFEAARRKADDLEFQVNIVSNLVNAGRYKTALKNIERLKQKIRNMRRAGLESRQQEFSIENIAFKILRRNGILELLSDLKTNTYDNLMNINGEDSSGAK